MNIKPVIEISELRFRYSGASSDCLFVQSLSLLRGETLFIRGPSGCGKSTLLSLMAGVLLSTSGSIHLLGQSWKALSATQRDAYRAANIGYIFQQFNLLPFLNARENVALSCRFSSNRAERALRAKPQASLLSIADELLGQFGIDASLGKKNASALSVGQQQRVAAARALMGEPAIIIADEPTSALDDDLRDTFMAALLSACKQANSSLVFVSHDRSLAKHFDRAIDLP